MQTCEAYVSPSRRKFLQTIGLGGGAMLLSTLAPGVALAGQADALLLTCMDYRLTDDIDRYMSGRGMTDKYDHVVLAGASLGVLTDKKPAWGEVFWDHLEVAKALHHIHEVIVLDHLDCGAYRVFLGDDAVKTRQAEHLAHDGYLRRLKAEIGRRHPDLQVEIGIMSLDGKVETLA